MNDAERLELPHVIDEHEAARFDQIGDRPHYYDKRGNPLSFRDWARLRHWDEHSNNNQYTIIKQETLGDYWISTVWLGLNHAWHLGPPLIFETMVFKGEESDLDCMRYSTEEEAIAGHKAMVEKVRLITEATS